MFMLSRIPFLRLVILIAGAAVMLQAAPSARAGEPHEFSESEMVGLAFYKLAHRQPNFGDWIDAATPAEGLAQQKAKLKKGLARFTPGQDVITITSTGVVNLPVIDAKDAKSFEREKPVELMLGQQAEMSYFPVQIGRVWIAVVPAQEDAFKTLMVPIPEYERIENVLGLQPNVRAGGAGIRIALRPMRVDTHAPIMLDHKEMWLMMADIASIEVWDRPFKHMAWSYNAPWYMSGETHDLMNLYSEH
jgi:hypothetical protein